MNARKSQSASQEIQSAAENETGAPKAHDKRALLVFFSFVAGLVVLVALNMK